MESLLFFIAPAGSLFALLFAYIFYKSVMKADDSSGMMKEMAGHVRESAYAYLKQQYTVVTIVFAVIVILLSIPAYFGIQNPFVPIAFLTGGFFSGLCGFLGMKTATSASGRTVEGARNSLSRGLQVAFRAGAVMGLAVVGFGLLDIAAWYITLNYIYDNNVWNLSHMLAVKVGLIAEYGTFDMNMINAESFKHAKLVEITTTMVTFGMGASTLALFARMGGGIFSKAAGMGVELVCKTEAGIHENDTRNPATIAHNVGNNAGDVTGMGADLYESYCGSILATATLGAALPLTGFANINAVIAPMIIAGMGIIFSITGIYFVRTHEDASTKVLFISIQKGVWGSSLLMVIALAVMAYGSFITWGIFGATIAGLITGLVIGQSSEYFISDEYGPAKGIAKQNTMGPSTGILDGVAVGMLSSTIPVVTIVIGIMVAFGVSGGFAGTNEAVSSGLYGIGIAAVGMLASLGISLATIAYTSIARNAGDIAELSGVGNEVRERTNTLDMPGNITAAAGKGFAIGSAALTVIALLSVYLEEVKWWIGKYAMLSGSGYYQVGNVKFYNNLPQAALDPAGVLVTNAHFADFVRAYDITLMNPKVFCGLFLGSMIIMAISALTIKAVGEAAVSFIEEVRRQFLELPGILRGEQKPDYVRCIVITTKNVQRNIMLPSLIAFVVPVATGLMLGVEGTVGLIAGALTGGFSIAFFLNNAGSAWSNARMYIEKGNHGGKGSNTHMAGVIGDKVGNPFKDASGPSLNVLIKFMAMCAVVFSGLVVKASPYIARLLGFSN